MIGQSKFQEYLALYDGDRYCLMCRHACPVGRVTKKESNTPHGWALLVASVQRGLLPWNQETVDVLYQCADCGLCQANCVTDRPLPYALMAARAEVVRLGHLPASVKALEDKLSTWGNPYGPVTDDAPRQQVTRSANNAAVALFVGDAAHFLRPSTIRAADQLLRAGGAIPVLFGQGRSSGYLPYTLGLWDTARAIARENVRALETSGARELVVLSVLDAHTWQNVYPELGVTLPDTVKITTWVNYLARVSERDPLPLQARAPQPYTYHDPAQAVRIKGHTRAARTLATQAMGCPPREMLWRENLATPLGTSGGLAFTHPSLAARLAQTRIQEVKSTAVAVVLTDDPLDTAVLEQYADGITVLNLLEVLAEQLAP